MSIVIIGGNDRMIKEYKTMCNHFGCTAKVFTQMSNTLKKQIGTPDFMILFTATVSHKMVQCALAEAVRSGTPVERSHSSSMSALKNILQTKTKMVYS